jgi:predicted metal-dependent peptidase
MKRIIDELGNPEVDWRSYIHSFITAGLPNDYTFRRRDKKSMALGYYIPDMTGESLKVATFIDTSGSIGDKELRKFKTELVGLCRTFEQVNMILGYCDAKVYDKYIIEVNDDNENAVMKSVSYGGGGTDMRECLKWLNKNRKDFQLVIIFTDGYTPFPITDAETFGFNILWVINKNGIRKDCDDIKRAKGEFVFMNENE